jgi:hypothetical protein
VHFGAPPVSKIQAIDKISKKSLHYQNSNKKRPQRLLIEMPSFSEIVKGGQKMPYMDNLNFRAKK